MSVIEQNTAETQAGSPASAGSEARPRLLIVEDNPMNRLMLGVVAERAGLDQIAVGCIEEALLRFAREAFDAVLIDIDMDDGAGLAIGRPIRAMAGDAAPPVLAYGDNQDADALEAAGFSGVVETPVDSQRLVAALVAALEHDLAAEAATAG